MGDKFAVELKDIRFSWQREVVLGVDDFKVARGETLFLGGPSGSGKTTMLSLLAGVTVPQQGEVRLLGQALESMRASQRDQFRADHIGYIFQMFNLVPYLSVTENVSLPLRFSSERAAKVGNANEEAERLLVSLGMGDYIHRRVLDLSVGQQQRVAAARALIGKPEILLADEPTSALDKRNSEAFVELLFQECQQAGASLIFVSHDTDLARHFDRSHLLGGAPV